MAYKILKKENLAQGIDLLEIASPLVAAKAKAGQFMMVRIHEQGERIPLTIFDWDKERGSVSVISQAIGKTTKHLASLDAGFDIVDFAGPLGRPSDTGRFGTVVCIGGGVGAASIFPVARAFKEAGNFVISIIGARTSALVILEKELRAVSDDVYITTDDGSRGAKGFVTDELKKIIAGNKKIDRIFEVGPVRMMKAIAELAKVCNISTIASLNANMVDATGMCGTCRVSVGGKIYFSCVDGPDFDARAVDFDEMLIREKRFKPEEKLSLDLYQEGCNCRAKQQGR